MSSAPVPEAAHTSFVARGRAAIAIEGSFAQRVWLIVVEKLLVGLALFGAGFYTNGKVDSYQRALSTQQTEGFRRESAEADRLRALDVTRDERASHTEALLRRRDLTNRQLHEYFYPLRASVAVVAELRGVADEARGLHRARRQRVALPDMLVTQELVRQHRDLATSTDDFDDPAALEAARRLDVELRALTGHISLRRILAEGDDTRDAAELGAPWPAQLLAVIDQRIEQIERRRASLDRLQRLRDAHANDEHRDGGARAGGGPREAVTARSGRP